MAQDGGRDPGVLAGKDREILGELPRTVRGGAAALRPDRRPSVVSRPVTAATSTVTGSAAPTAEATDILRPQESGATRGQHRPENVPGGPVRRRLAWVPLPGGGRRARCGTQAAARRRPALATAGARRPDVACNIIGQGMAAPTIAVHGTRSSRPGTPPLFSGEEIWCSCSPNPLGVRPGRPLGPPGRCGTATSGSSTARRCDDARAHRPLRPAGGRTDPTSPSTSGSRISSATCRPTA